MMAYVDTNVILARYFPDDKLHDRATRFLERDRERKIISPISLAELAAVLSRLDVGLRAADELLQAPPKRRIRALVEFMVKDSNLLVASVPVQAKFKVAGTVLLAPIEYHSCIRFAHLLRLKTLDLLHLVYADNLRKSGHDLNAFATFDKEILAKAELVQQEMEIEVKEP